MKHIVIEVSPDGKITIAGAEFKGNECDKKMAEFEKELGQVTSRKNSPDYYVQTATTKAVATQKA